MSSQHDSRIMSDALRCLTDHAAQWPVLQRQVLAWFEEQERLCAALGSTKVSLDTAEDGKSKGRLELSRDLNDDGALGNGSKTVERAEQTLKSDGVMLQQISNESQWKEEQASSRPLEQQFDSSTGRSRNHAVSFPDEVGTGSDQNCRTLARNSSAELQMSAGNSVGRYQEELENDLEHMEKEAQVEDWVQGGIAKMAGHFDDFLDKYGQGLPMDTWLRKFVFSAGFEWLTTTIILANAVVMILKADYAIQNPAKPEHTVLDTLELVFTLFYTIEICLRIVASGWSFLFSDDWRWNVVDVFLVLNALWDQIQPLLADDGEGVNISFIRITRLMKLTRLLRTVRIFKFFRELRLIISSMFVCARTMIWSIVLIVLTTYIFGLCFVQAGFTYLQDNEGDDPQLDHDIRLYFGSVGEAMLTLYVAATNGDSWIKYDKTLRSIGAVYHVIFLVFITFFMLTVANTMTALFIESTQMLAEKDDSTLVREELQRRYQFIQKVKQLWSQLDSEKSGMINMPDVHNRLHTTDMLSFANSLGLDPLDMEDFFKVLSENGTKAVDAETFITGCFKLKGHARSLDMISVMHMVQSIHAQQRQDWMRASKMLGTIALRLEASAAPTPVHHPNKEEHVTFQVVST